MKKAVFTKEAKAEGNFPESVLNHVHAFNSRGLGTLCALYPDGELETTKLAVTCPVCKKEIRYVRRATPGIDF